MKNAVGVPTAFFILTSQQLAIRNGNLSKNPYRLSLLPTPIFASTIAQEVKRNMRLP